MKNLKLIFVFENDHLKKQKLMQSILRVSFGKTFQLNYPQKKEPKDYSNSSLNLDICKKIYKNKIKLKFELAEKTRNTKLFSDYFINEQMNYKIIINNKICSPRNLIDMNNNDNCVSLKIIFSNKGINLISMFQNCKDIKSLSGKLEINPLYIKSISKMFYCCKSLESLSDLIFFDTSNVEDMSLLFYRCTKLEKFA